MEEILKDLVIDDTDGETFMLYGPQRAPFDMMDGHWSIVFNEEGTWQAIQYEDEDDPHGTIELEGNYHSS